MAVLAGDRVSAEVSVLALREYVRRLVDQAPPLTAQQRGLLRGLLRPGLSGSTRRAGPSAKPFPGGSATKLRTA